MFSLLDFQMSNSYFSMRNLATIALLLFGSMTVARAAEPPHGTVTGVDQSAHTFTVQWLGTYKSRGGGTRSISRERTMKTTDKTIYLVGNTKGSWSDIHKGAHVHIVSHPEGSYSVVDKVQILSGS
jgi:hypothetical protein